LVREERMGCCTKSAASSTSHTKLTTVRTPLAKPSNNSGRIPNWFLGLQYVTSVTSRSPAWSSMCLCSDEGVSSQ
jgi:hypothetical protein